MHPRIILTSDRSWMSEYSGIMFLGFATCFPKGFLPDFLFFKIFCPPVEQKNGVVKYAPYGLRKIEASLLENGFNQEDIAVIDPEHIGRYIKHAKVVGIGGNDILGKGPTTQIITQIIGVDSKKAYSAFKFHELYYRLQKYKKKYNFKTILGGPGSWQVLGENYDIDCVVLGEAENIAADLFRKALNGEELPRQVEGTIVDVEKIPLIKNPSLGGLIEITRGCGRGCRFCTPTMRAFRCYPIEKIIKEITLNVKAGRDLVLLHGEDVLRYQANGFRVNRPKVEQLFREVARLVPKENINMSHIALSSALQEPRLIENIAEILNLGSKEYPWTSAQTGIESASSRLIAKYMKGKTLPYTAEQWGEVVRESFKLLAGNNWVPCATLIMGLPGERPDDIVKTTELVDDLKDYKSLIIPLFYVPMGTAAIGELFTKEKMHYEHWELLAASAKHSIKWMKGLAYDTMNLKSHGFSKAGLDMVVKIWERSTLPYLDSIRDGQIILPRNLMDTALGLIAKKPIGRLYMKKEVGK